MRRLTACLLALTLSGCDCNKPGKPGPGENPVAAPTGPKELKEVEPNDTPATAMPLRESARVSADLKADPARPDEDIYRLEPLGVNRVADFEASGIPGVDIAVELLDRDGNHVALLNSEGDGKPER